MCSLRAAEERSMRLRHRGLEILVLILVLAAACAGKPAAPVPSALRILVTNDDGIEAPGILAVAEALRPLGQVTVAAPLEPRSGSSHGVTSDRPIAVRETERGGQRWIAIDALPATCVRLAVEELLSEMPDLVISGINRGENLGTVTFYSATVGAAREAAFLGLPAVAVNLVAANGLGYETAAAVTAQIIGAIGPKGIPKGTFLNINVPPLLREGLRGVRLTRQDMRAPIDRFKKTVRPDGTTAYLPRWEHLEPAAEGTDIWAVRNGYVSVSLFGFDQTAAAPPGALAHLRRLETLRLSIPPDSGR
jgi:5'-nucleotidase